MSTPNSSSIRRDIASAYLASAAKVGSWALISALLYRQSQGDFAMFALVRATIGLLNYTSLGLAPAMVRVIAQARSEIPFEPLPRLVNTSNVLDYATPPSRKTDPTTVAYSNGLVLALLSAGIGLSLTIVYAAFATQLHRAPGRWVTLTVLVVTLGAGTILRLLSDAAGAVLQTHEEIASDNKYLIFTEVAWLLLTLLILTIGSNPLGAAAGGYVVSGYLLLRWRFLLAHGITHIYMPAWASVDTKILRQLLSAGLLIAIAQLADFLYAPTDYILISRFLEPSTIATYAPAVQIDAALLLLVTGVASVLLPRTAIAHAANDLAGVRRNYIKGTIGSTAILTSAALITWIASPLILRVWLGGYLAETEAILPLVLIHTVVGGSSTVGRSILLATGRIRAFTISVLIAGAVNVLLSWFFVTHLNLGLRGIIYGTIIAVVGRCALWMPAYVLWTLRKN